MTSCTLQACLDMFGQRVLLKERESDAAYAGYHREVKNNQLVSRQLVPFLLPTGNVSQICASMLLCVCVCVCVCVCMCVGMIYMIFMFVCVCMYVCMCICMYVCVCMYV
jgi:hypothetical protein